MHTVNATGALGRQVRRVLRTTTWPTPSALAISPTPPPFFHPHQRLLGHMDLDTREWFDGVLTAAARQVVKEPPEVR